MERRRAAVARRAALAALSGALLLLAAPPLGGTPLAFVALVPLLAALRDTTPAAAVALGWTAGAVFHLGLVPWLVPTVARLQGCAVPAALAWFGLYVAWHAGQFALLAIGVRLAAPGRAAAAAVAAWLLAEAAFPKVLPWSLGAVLGPHPLLRQGADLAGAPGLGALVVAVNALLAVGLGAWRRRRRAAGAALAGAGALLLGGAAYGHLPAAATPAGHLRVALVQGGPDADRDLEPGRAAAAALRRYARLSRRRAAAAELLVWPEQVLSVPLRHSPEHRAALERQARRLGVPLLLGALDRGADGADRSAAYLFAPRLRGVAHKALLVPFGEYVPGAGRWPALRRWRLASPLRAGSGDAVLALGAARLAPAICVEAIRPAAFNAAVTAGAELLVNLSDDSWFDSPWAAAQHLEMTRLRAVETRRWLLRASHSGMSAVVDAHGRVVARRDYGRAGALVARVERRREVTPYVRAGDTPTLLLALLLGAWALRPRWGWTGRRGPSSELRMPSSKVVAAHERLSRCQAVGG